MADLRGVTNGTSMRRTFCLVAFVCGLASFFATPVHGAAHTFSPSSVSDSHGNTADHDSTITWGDLPQGRDYTITEDNVDYDPGELEHFYKMMNFFLDAVFVKSVPYDAMREALKGEINIKEFGLYIAGYAVCVLAGFIFFFVMPLIGLIFCCCRVCGDNCGASKVWKSKYDKNLMSCCICQAVSLTLITLILLCGSALLYVTNQELGDTTQNFGKIINNNLDDAKTFVDNTVAEFEHVGVTNFNFTTKVIQRDLDNIGYLVGIPVRSTLHIEGNIGQTMNGADNINILITKLTQQMDTVDTKTSELTSRLTTLSTDLSSVRTDLDTLRWDADCVANAACFAACDPSGLNTNIDTANFPDITAQKLLMNSVRSENLTANIEQGKADFENIPQRVETDSASKRQTIDTELNNFVTNVQNGLSDITSLSNDVDPELDKVQQDVDKYFGEDTYDKYRWYAVIGLSCIILLVVLFNLLGLVLGGIGFNRDPLDRTSLSQCASCFLITSVALVFIFSWILMLLCTLTFALGAPLGAVVCKHIQDTRYTVFKELLDGPVSVLGEDGEYPLAKMVLGSKNAHIKVTFSDMLRGCKFNEASWNVLKLDNRLDIKNITDYKKDVDIEAQIQDITIDLSNVEFFDANTQQQLDDFKNAVNINYDQYINELNKDTTATDLSTKAAALRTVMTPTDIPLQHNIHSIADRLDTIRTTSFANADVTKSQLLQAVQEMKTSSVDVAPAVDNFSADMQATETFIQNNGSDVVRQKLGDFAQREVAVADSYVAKVNSAVQNEIARCRPLYNFWHSLLVNALCDQLIGNFNAFWFSLGWCIFFMIPSIILSVKFTKYLRQFDYRDGESPPKTPAKEEDVNLSWSRLRLVPNQVAPEPYVKEKTFNLSYTPHM